MTERKHKARRSGGNRTSPQTTALQGNAKHTAVGRTPVSPQRARAALAFYAPTAVPRRRT